MSAAARTLARLSQAHGRAAIFFALLAGAIIAGASTSVHNGLTLLALLLLAAAIYVGLPLAAAEDDRRAAERAAALAEGVAR